MADGDEQLGGGLGPVGKPPAERDPSKLQINRRLDDLRLACRLALSGAMTAEGVTKFRDDIQHLFDTCEKPRQKAAYGKILASLHKTSLTTAIAAIKIENDIEIPPTPQQPTITNNYNIMAVIDEARRDPSYVQFERQRTIEAGTVARLNGGNGQPRIVDANAAPRTD